MAFIVFQYISITSLFYLFRSFDFYNDVLALDFYFIHNITTVKQLTCSIWNLIFIFITLIWWHKNTS